MLAGRPIDPVFATVSQACDPGLVSRVEAVLVCEAGLGEQNLSELELLADAMVSSRLRGVFVSPDTSGVVPGVRDAFVTVPAEASADELWGRLATIREYRPLLAEMEQQVAGMQRLGKKLNQQFVEVDQELRLASRLQRDFLPKAFPEIGDLRFAALYRPASWVSGDVYDVQRLDESRIGVYLADAVGHGVAAGLLTMFIKQAVTGKRIAGDHYVLVPPHEVLAALNAQLSDQQLPNCQFVTACYALVDAATHELVFSRGGHPYPIHVGPDGSCREARTTGGLLGIFPGEEFPSNRLLLEPGAKFIIYSDGLEDVLLSRESPGDGAWRFSRRLQEIAGLPLHDFLRAVTLEVEQSEGSLQPRDDMTMIVLERLR